MDKVLAHWGHRWDRQLGADEATLLFEDIPTFLRIKVGIELKFHELLEKVFFLKGCPSGVQMSTTIFILAYCL